MPEGPGLLLRGGWLWTDEQPAEQPAPGAPVSGLLRDGAVLCRGEHIAEVGAYAELRAKHPHAEELGGPHVVLLPGLINAHHHGRGLDPLLMGSKDANLEVWLADRAGEPLIDPYLDTLWAAANLLTRGVTTVVHFVLTPEPARALEHAEARLRAWQDAGIRVALGLDVRQQRFLAYEDEAGVLAHLQPEVAAAVREQAAKRRPLGGEEYLGLFAELEGKHGASPRTRFFLAPAGPQWVEDETLAMIGDYSRANGTLVHTHALETPYQRAAAPRLYGASLIEHLRSLGFLGDRTSLVHAVWVSEAEIETLAATGTNVIHNPGSNLRLSSGIAPLPALLEAGVNVAIGTDGFTLGPDDLLNEARLAYNLHRWPGVGAPKPSHLEVLRAITTGAAAVTPFGAQIGSLRVGAKADVTLLDLDGAAGPFLSGDSDPLEALLQSADGRHVLATVVAGEVVAEGGAPTRVNMEELAAELAGTVRHRSREVSSAVADATALNYQQRWDPASVESHWPRNGR